MNDASSLIEQMERETGQRIDDHDGDNFAIAGLFGVLARAMGNSNHQARDDVAAGVLIRHQMTPEWEAEQRAKRLMAEMMVAGVSPASLKELMG